MSNKTLLANTARRRSLSSLTMAAAFGLFAAAGSFAVHAQATAGSIFGKAPAGETVRAKSLTTGLQRDVAADAKGRFVLRALPIGIYNVTLEKDGQPVLTRAKVQVVVGRGSHVDLDCAQDSCGAK